MNFTERYLSFSSGHGDGAFEVLLLILVVAMITFLGLGFFRNCAASAKKDRSRRTLCTVADSNNFATSVF